jgi:hypothetical protein
MKPPRTGIKVSIGLHIVAVLVIYALVNYLSFLHYERRDFSRSQKFSLAGQTRAVLKEFKKPLEVIIISSPTFLSPVSQIFGDLRSLMNEVLFNKREGLRIEYVDPTRNLSRIQDLQAKYKLTSLDNLIILDYEGRHRLLNIAEMGDFDLTPLAQGGQPVLLAFRGEQVLTSALLALLKPDSETVYFLTGHGELSADRELSNLSEAISQQNAVVKTLSLSSADEIPPDASSLILVAPKSDLDEREAAVIGAWLRKGGKMLVLLDPNSATPRLHALLANSGIIPRDDRVLRLIQLPLATGILRDVTAHGLPNAEVPRRLEGLNIAIVGDILFSRVARSNIFGLLKLGANVTLVGPSTLVPKSFEKLGVRVSHRLDDILAEVDVVNLLRIQHERQRKEYFPGLGEYVSLFGLTKARAAKLKPSCLIMHPGPINRGVEIDSDIADGHQSVILEQVTNGIAVRMAVLYSCAGGAGVPL